jgi:hypothetical protein
MSIGWMIMSAAIDFQISSPHRVHSTPGDDHSEHLLSLGRPAGAADRSYLPIAGDSAPAKAAVTEFIESVGYSVVDAGPLVDSWRQATGTPVWGLRTGRHRTRRASRSARTPSARHWPAQRGNRVCFDEIGPAVLTEKISQQRVGVAVRAASESAAQTPLAWRHPT